MLELASKQPGFLGFETARQEIGISVSYWSTPEAIKAWKENVLIAKLRTEQKTGIKLFGFVSAVWSASMVFSLMPNKQLVPTPETARHASWCFRGRRGTAAR